MAGTINIMMMPRTADQKRRNEALFIAHLQAEGGAGLPVPGSNAVAVGPSCVVSSSSKRAKTASGAGIGRLPVSPSSSSSPSSKERKDKIGEKVAALQQLVSPYGKTDTVSVLQEATSYIKFLHDQVQVLSAPYLRTPPIDPFQGYSLRSRGLCLVPAEYVATFARNNGADLWAPTNTTTSSSSNSSTTGGGSSVTTSYSPRF